MFAKTVHKTAYNVLARRNAQNANKVMSQEVAHVSKSAKRDVLTVMRMPQKSVSNALLVTFYPL